MNVNDHYYDTGMADDRHERLFDVMLVDMIYQRHITDTRSMTMMAAHYQTSQEISQHVPANNNKQFEFQKTAKGFFDNSDMLEPVHKAEITTIDLSGEMLVEQLNQFQSSVKIITNYTPIVHAVTASNTNENDEIKPIIDTVATTTLEFASMSVAHSVKEETPVRDLAEEKASNVIHVLYWNERKQPA